MRGGESKTNIGQKGLKKNEAVCDHAGNPKFIESRMEKHSHIRMKSLRANLSSV